jgi:tRNA U34 5-methylaminomethyl-2-thiouridine-forming methyltransferase MnmC
MAIPRRPTTQTSTAGLHWQLTDDGSRTLWDEHLDETYHSGCGAVAESLVVYLSNSGVHKRLSAGQGSAVLEYGFGTATAFLLTAADALIHGVALRYRALEISLLPAEILAELQLKGSTLHPVYRQEFGEVLDVAQSLLAEFVQWRSKLAVTPARGIYNCALRANIDFEIVIGDAVHYDRSDLFNAIYFDPFSPASCPELWSVPVFRYALSCLHEGGTLTSYCVKSSVRHDLSSVGFGVSRLPGPIGGKREVLLATKVRALD